MIRALARALARLRLTVRYRSRLHYDWRRAWINAERF